MNDALGTPEILPPDTRHKDLARPDAHGDATDRHTRGCVTDALALGISGDGATGFVMRAPALRDLRTLATAAGPDSLPFWATHYLEAVAVGGSPHTLDAKSRDLKAFVAWFGKTMGTLSVRAWRVRDTKSYMGYLTARRLAPTTVNRAFATLRHFARWAQEAHALFGTMGLPTRGVEERPTDDPPCKKLDAHEVRALFKRPGPSHLARRQT